MNKFFISALLLIGLAGSAVACNTEYNITLQTFKQGFILTDNRDISSLLLVGITFLFRGIICRPLLHPVSVCIFIYIARIVFF